MRCSGCYIIMLVSHSSFDLPGGGKATSSDWFGSRLYNYIIIMFVLLTAGCMQLYWQHIFGEGLATHISRGQITRDSASDDL